MRARSAALVGAAALLALAGCGADPAATPERPTATRTASAPATRATRATPVTQSPSPTPRVTVTPTPTSIVPTNLDTTGLLPPIDLRIDAALHGGDISWPQCPKGVGIPHKMGSGSPLPLASARFVVVGLTNGPGFYRNPCLADQVSYARQRGLLTSAYAVASFPDDATRARYASAGPFDGTTELGALANVGYVQAKFNISSMVATGLTSPIVFIDVEPVPYYPWSGDPAANAAVVRGAARGYEDSGYRVGVYSTPYLWQEVVGDLRLGDDVPEWRAAGHTSETEAVTRCGPEWSIQGGSAVLGQWVEGSRDLNVTCPVVRDVGGLFGSS